MRDPRSIANFILDIAAEKDVKVTNLALNKIAYFLHGIYLANKGEPLIDAKIEAWQYGPVFREIYHEFKAFDREPIKGRARQIDLQTGKKIVCEYHFSQDEIEFLSEAIEPYFKMSAGNLVDLSHIHDGPWYKAWYHEDRVNPGMEITNEAIAEYFSQQVRH
jgi:uncharacterized phage-associated protein